MSASFDRMCAQAEELESMRIATRVKRLFEATRCDPPSDRRLVNDGLKAIGFILSSMERELDVKEDAL